MPSKPTEVEVPDGEFTLTYVRGGRRASSDALVEQVRSVLAPWKGRLAPSTLAPDALTDRTWLWVVRLSNDWWAVATNAPVRDALARRLATRLRTSAVWFRRQAGTASYELRYGTAQPEGRHDAEIRARQTLPVLETRQFLVDGAVTVKETPAHAALRAIAKCRRGHRNTLDLTMRMMEDPDLDVDVELVDPEHRQAPPFFEDLRADTLDDAEGWVRLADGRPARQHILWARRCEKCAAPVYGAVEWDGCLRRVRALPKRRRRSRATTCCTTRGTSTRTSRPSAHAPPPRHASGPPARRATRRPRPSAAPPSTPSSAKQTPGASTSCSRARRGMAPGRWRARPSSAASRGTTPSTRRRRPGRRRSGRWASRSPRSSTSRGQ